MSIVLYASMRQIDRSGYPNLVVEFGPKSPDPER
jgi:hypothetical protein